MYIYLFSVNSTRPKVDVLNSLSGTSAAGVVLQVWFNTLRIFTDSSTPRSTTLGNEFHVASIGRHRGDFQFKRWNFSRTSSIGIISRDLSRIRLIPGCGGGGYVLPTLSDLKKKKRFLTNKFLVKHILVWKLPYRYIICSWEVVIRVGFNKCLINRLNGIEYAGA